MHKLIKHPPEIESISFTILDRHVASCNNFSLESRTRHPSYKIIRHTMRTFYQLIRSISSLVCNIDNCHLMRWKIQNCRLF